MNTRCRHDLYGCKSRMQSSLNSWREAVQLVQESWSDETARKFSNESLSETESTLSRMMASLQEAGEMVRNMEKRVVDEQFN